MNEIAKIRKEEWGKAIPSKIEGIVKEILGDKYQMLVPMYFSSHAVLKIVSFGGCDIPEYTNLISDALEPLDWQLAVVEDEAKYKRPIYLLAPFDYLSPDLVYHVTPSNRIHDILRVGLLPSNPERKHTDFSDTDGKIHFCENLEGDFSVKRWVSIFSDRYKKAPEDYGIVRVDLSGLAGRIYRDIRSDRGIVIDKISSVTPERIHFIRNGNDNDLKDSILSTKDD